MGDWSRRSILATGVGLSVGSGLASAGTGRDDGDGGLDDSAAEGDPDFARPTGVAWRYDGPFDVGSTVATDGRVYTQTAGGVYALDAEDGSREWETGDIGAGGTPAVEDDTLYVPGEPVRAIDVETGEVRWESEIGSAEMAVGHGTVYTSDDDAVYALDADDGSVRWEHDDVDAETDDGEVTVDELTVGDVGGEAVYAFGPNPDAQGSVIAALDPATGDPMSAVAYGDRVIQHRRRFRLRRRLRRRRRDRGLGRRPRSRVDRPRGRVPLLRHRRRVLRQREERLHGLPPL